MTTFLRHIRGAPLETSGCLLVEWNVGVTFEIRFCECTQSEGVPFGFRLLEGPVWQVLEEHTQDPWHKPILEAVQAKT